MQYEYHELYQTLCDLPYKELGYSTPDKLYEKLIGKSLVKSFIACSCQGEELANEVGMLKCYIDSEINILLGQLARVPSNSDYSLLISTTISRITTFHNHLSSRCQNERLYPGFYDEYGYDNYLPETQDSAYF